MRSAYPACFYPCEEGGFAVMFPDLPGAVTEGDTLEEAIANAISCACGWIIDELEAGKEVPSPSPMDAILCDAPGGFKKLILVELDG